MNRNQSRHLCASVGAVIVLCAHHAWAETVPATQSVFDRLDNKGKIELTSLRGRVVVVDFWATWCEPCKRSLPEHEKLVERFSDDVTLIALSVDEKPETARAFAEKRGLKLLLAYDASGKAAEAFGVRAMPYAVVLDREGKIAERIEGEPYPRLVEVVERIVQSTAPRKTGGDTPRTQPEGRGQAQPVSRNLAESGACAKPAEGEAKIMGTKVRVRICPEHPAPGVSSADEAIERVFSEFRRLEALWTTWSPTSDISRINRNAGGAPVPIADETLWLLTRAVEAGQETGGAFDITFGPLGDLWQFDTPPDAHAPTKLTRIPTPAEINKARALVDYKRLELDPKKKTARLKHRGMKIHAGGIGKGAAVDLATRQLRERGFRNFFIQAGGDLYCAGKNGDRGWWVGIAHPREPGQVLGGVELSDAAFSTSGDYERFAIIDGKRYHHLIDLKTGFPSTQSQSATVLAKTAIDAEVMTKVAFLIGGAEGVRQTEKMGGMAVVVDGDGRHHKSSTITLVGGKEP